MLIEDWRMANEFDNVERTIGRTGETVTSNNNLVSEAYAGMTSLRAFNVAQGDAGVDQTFGQLTLTGGDLHGHTGRTREAQQTPAPFDLRPDAEARRRAETARRLFQQWQQQVRPVNPH